MCQGKIRAGLQRDRGMCEAQRISMNRSSLNWKAGVSEFLRMYKADGHGMSAVCSCIAKRWGLRVSEPSGLRLIQGDRREGDRQCPP